MQTLENYFKQTKFFPHRALDVTCAMLGILALAPIFVIVTIAIRLTSQGPAIFSQKRTGLNGKHFTVYKYRSLRIDVCRDDYQVNAENRVVTPIGGFLRSSSIDELPQLFNVLLGDMSIVGPRPHPLSLDKRFRPYFDNLDVRYLVKPGITGLAQINGCRGETSTEQDFKERLDLDLSYIQNKSLWFDIKIIMKTFLTIWNKTNRGF